MAITFKNAPLVELIAELRWQPQFSTATDQGGNQLLLPQSLLNPSEGETFFQRFFAAVYQHGFKQMERLAPQGVPLPHDRMVCRYRHENQNEAPVLTQIGPSIFSVNALPPYKSWLEFRPWIVHTVESLLEANPNPGSFKASVRYIDAFKEPFLNGRSVSQFFESTLGFSLNLPNALTGRKLEGGEIRSSVSTIVPLDGMQMTVKLSEGKVDGEQAAIMDTLVTINGDIAPNKESVMKALDSARGVIHETFFELTKPIENALEPEGEDSA